MSRTCRTCGANATHHALEHIPRQIIDGRGREWNMQDEVLKWYCDTCAPEWAAPFAIEWRDPGAIGVARDPVRPSERPNNDQP